MLIACLKPAFWSRFVLFSLLTLFVFACSEDATPVESNFQMDVQACVSPCTVKFSNESSGAETYQWNFGDGSTSTQTNPSHTFNSEGRFTVELISQNGEQSSTATATVEVIDPDVCKKVKVFYVIPSDQLDNEAPIQVLEDAVEENRQLWSKFGATFITEPLVKIYSDMTTDEFLTKPDGLHGSDAYYWFGNGVNQVVDNSEVVLNDPNFKSIMFIQVPVPPNCGCAAVANFHVAAIPSGMIASIQNGVGADIGVIGHELGHTFGMPHEDCLNQPDPRGIMCNGTNGGGLGFPNVQLTQWHYDYLFNQQHNAYFVEKTCN